MSTNFIDTETAAKRSGWDRGHIGRLCRTKWVAEGLAKLDRPDSGSKASWFVREDADPKFALVKFPEQIGTDLRHITQKKRDEAYRRLRILNGWDKAIRAGLQLRGFDKDAITNHFLERLQIDEGELISRGTLYNWNRAYRATGVAGLIDGRGGDKEAKPPCPFFEEVKKIYLSLARPKLSKCHGLAIEKASVMGWEVKSYKACQRMIEAIPKAVVLKYRFGDEAYKNQAEPFIERDYTTLESNEAWNADHHQFDVLVKISDRLESGTGEVVTRHVRPWITCFQDIRSRKIMGWDIFAHDPNTDTILTAFRRSVMDHGVPKVLFIDNGKDFDSFVLNGRTKKDRWAKRKVRVDLDPDRSAGLFNGLDIDVRHVKPYHGQSKPIERFFGELEQNTFCWPTYCGNSTATKPENLQLNLERNMAPTLEDFSAWFADWLIGYEAGHEHSGQGMEGKNPNQVYAENLFTRRTASRELLDQMCLTRFGPVKSMQNGVNFKGMRYGQHDPVLHQMHGRQVMLYVDERDISSVQVWSADGKFLCIAPCNEKVPYLTSKQDLRQVTEEKNRDRKLLKQFVERRPRMAEDFPDRITRRAAAKAIIAHANNTDPTPPQPNIRPVRSAFEDQMPALQRAIERSSNMGKVAVGAEQTSLVDIAHFVRPEESTNAQSEGDAFAMLGAKFRTEETES